MSEALPPWLANVDPRFVRHDWQKWLRPDWQRWMPPDPGPSMRERLWRPYREEQPPQRSATGLTEADILFFRSNLSALRFKVTLLKLKLKALHPSNYNPEQPRVPAGNPDGGQWTSEDENSSAPSQTRVAGLVIRICVAGSHSVTTDQWGNKSYWVEYQCAGGRTIERRGSGGGFKGFILDPLQ